MTADRQNNRQTDRITVYVVIPVPGIHDIIMLIRYVITQPMPLFTVV